MHIGGVAAPFFEPSRDRPDMDTTDAADTQGELPTMMGSVASTSTVRSSRGAAKNVSLKKHLKRTKQRIRIDIPPSYMTPLNDWCTLWTQEFDIICRQYALFTAFSWLQMT